MTVGQGQYGSRRGCNVAAKLCSASANLASSKMLRYQPSGHSPLSDCLNDKKNFFVICSSFVAGVPLHRQHCNRYSVHNATPCSKTRCCVVLPRKHENKHKRERSCTKICSLPVVKSLESTEDFKWQNLFVHKKFSSTKSFLYVACHPL